MIRKKSDWQKNAETDLGGDDAFPELDSRNLANPGLISAHLRFGGIVVTQDKLSSHSRST